MSTEKFQKVPFGRYKEILQNGRQERRGHRLQAPRQTAKCLVRV